MGCPIQGVCLYILNRKVSCLYFRLVMYKDTNKNKIIVSFFNCLPDNLKLGVISLDIHHKVRCSNGN